MVHPDSLPVGPPKARRAVGRPLSGRRLPLGEGPVTAGAISPRTVTLTRVQTGFRGLIPTVGRGALRRRFGRRYLAPTGGVEAGCRVRW